MVKTKKRIKCVCLSAIVIGSVFNSGKNYYPQTILEKCKYKMKQKEIKSLIGYDIEISFDD